MTWLIIALAMGGVGLLAAPLLLAVRASSDVEDLARKLQTLTDRVQQLEGREPSSLPIPGQIECSPVQEPAVPEPIQTVTRPADEPFSPWATSRRPPPGPDWEKLLAENWMVWLGGITLALGGAFLVKYSVEHGMLTPFVRVLLGIALGIAMSGAAEWVARRDRQIGAAAAAPSPIPAALAAAGTATIFASLYAAHQLYDLLPAGPAFLLLAGTAALAIVMSLRHGPFVAAVGLVGAFAVPLLVRSDEPHALFLFTYFALVTAASLVLLRHKAWWWLAWLSLGGSLGWALLWLATPYAAGDAGVIGVFLLVLLGLFAAFRQGVPALPFISLPIYDPMIRTVVVSAFWAIAATMLLLVHTDRFTTESVLSAGAAAVFVLWFAYRDTRLDDLMAIAPSLLLALLVSWRLPMPIRQIDFLMHTVPPEEVDRFTSASTFCALFFGASGFAAIPHVPRPGRWAALSAIGPLAVLAVGYWRLHPFALDIAWVVIALGLAGINLAAADWIAKRRGDSSHLDAALAAYAIGVLGSTILAAAIGLADAWLTVALALHLPAIGWVDGRLRLPILRQLALGIATAVLVRLVLNPEVLNYPLSCTPIFNWLLYGYGVPTAAFALATRQFGSRADDLLVEVLEAGTITFAALLVTFELRQALGNTQIDLAPLGLLRDSTQSLAWLAMAAALLRVGERRQRRVLTWGGIILFGLATTQAVLWQALLANPVVSGDSVGPWFLLNALFLAYALPAIFYGGIAVLRLGPSWLWQSARFLALAFSFLWVTLEVRHAFRGEFLAQGISGQAEWYAYSATWLVFAGVCLVIGLQRQSEWLRKAALAGIGLVVAKVFLSDIASLGGMWRAISFLGLGAALVGIGYAYRRLLPQKRE